jgi:hypothetical protein
VAASQRSNRGSTEGKNFFFKPALHSLPGDDISADKSIFIRCEFPNSFSSSIKFDAFFKKLSSCRSKKLRVPAIA